MWHNQDNQCHLVVKRLPREGTGTETENTLLKTLPQTIIPTAKSKRIFKWEQMMANTSVSILLLWCQICGYRRDVAKWSHLLSSRSFLGASQGFSFRKRCGSFFESRAHDPWDVARVWLTRALLWRYKVIAARCRWVIIHFDGKRPQTRGFWNVFALT